jgi:hypothetical protein
MCREGTTVTGTVRAIAVVWGTDGTVLLSDYAQIFFFQRVLPAAQDYYVLVRGRPQGSRSMMRWPGPLKASPTQLSS